MESSAAFEKAGETFDRATISLWRTPYLFLRAQKQGDLEQALKTNPAKVSVAFAGFAYFFMPEQPVIHLSQ